MFFFENPREIHCVGSWLPNSSAVYMGGAALQVLSSSLDLSNLRILMVYLFLLKRYLNK